MLDSPAKDVNACAFPSLATDNLPFIHHGFPPNQKRRFGRCYNHLPGKDIGLHPEIKLPPLKTRAAGPCKKKVTPSSQYVSNNKACWRLKGINPKHVYSINRNKAVNDIRRNSESRSQTSRPTTKNDDDSIDGEMWTLFVGSGGAQATPRDADDRDGTKSEQQDDYMAKALTERLDECNEELGIRQKKAVSGRKLGNVLSTKRLKQILNNEERTLPYIFYKTHV